MNRQTFTMALGFVAGLGLGCTTAAVVAQDTAPKETSPPVAEDTAEAAARQPQVITMDEARVRVAPNGKGVAHLFVSGEQAYLGRLQMAGGGSVPKHRDPTEEYIYILEGSGTMTIDGVGYEVGPDTAIYMPAGAEVSFDNGPEELVALQVFADPGPEAKYDAWSAGPAPAAD